MKKDKKEFISKYSQEPGFTILNQGTEIEGDINTDRNIKLNGHLKGSCTSKNKIIISENCLIEGDIRASSIDIYGKVIGDINVDNVLFLAESSNIEGNCYTGKIKVEEGAVIQGYINKPGGQKRNVSAEGKSLPAKNDK
ncbi:MAG TPA: polymer-forming cytoskeletal protein [Balneolales bacterium]|nr:polymer-forming cytoskeletal protein [Balneolales bacterium]